jgi:23S rRNA (pseudouridine1915-N3)-methyltransferase
MMQLHLIFVGKTSFPEMDKGIVRYLERLQHYIPTEVHFIKAEKIGRKVIEEAVREVEGQRVLKLVGPMDYLIVWDQRGQQLDSIEFARLLQRVRDEGISRAWMVVGGPLGISPKLIEEANTTLSLSKMTFPHDLARVMVVEQLYRAFSILKGEPYHK